MTDIERLLTEALRESGENYEPSDQAEARRRFLERARRRRWYGFAQAAAFVSVGVGAVVFFMYFAGTEETVEPTPDVAGAPQIVATVEVDGIPTSIDSSAASEVWVAHTNQITAIDPATNEVRGVVHMGAATDEVAVGEEFVWVASDEPPATVYEVDMEREAMVDVAGADAPPDVQVRWDIAAAGNDAVAVDGFSGTVRFFSGEGTSLGREETLSGLVLSDVAMDENGIWVYDQTKGLLQEISADSQREFNVRSGSNSDLAVGMGFLWLSPGDGTLLRIEPTSGEIRELPLGDSYMDLTIGERSVWALVYVDDERKELIEVDPGSMEAIGEPLRLDGSPKDLVAGAGSVWVADGRGEVLRIEPSRDADDVPPPADDNGTEVEPSPAGFDDQVLFVYSANGDLFAEMGDGEVEQLTDTQEIEAHPSFEPGGNSILFTREVYDSFDDELPDSVRMDLSTGDEKVVGDGSWPVITANGSLATVDENSTLNGEPAAAISISTDPTMVPDTIGGDLEFPVVSNLSWAVDAESVVFQATGENAVVRQMSVNHPALEAGGVVGSSDSETLSPADTEEGSSLVSPRVSPDGWVSVLRLCCRETEGEPFESMTAGRVRQDGEGVTYEDIVAIPDIEGIEASFETSLVPAGHLDFDETSTSGDRWNSEGDAQSWFVIDDDMMWLVDSDGAAHYISGDPETSSAPGHEGETDFRGLAVHPSLLD